jgi:pimeloyl-ACP methyl ester carboxylesterase
MSDQSKSQNSKHYVLIHGAWEDSTIWNQVSPVLESRGHTVTAIDLPGHGANLRDLADVTLDGYVESAVTAIKSIDHQIVLVGHSMAGAVISQIAEQIPAKIERLIYVAAFLLKEGDSVLAAMQSDSDGELLSQIVFSEDQSYATVPEQVLRSVGFHDVDEEVIQRVLPHLVAKQATEPFLASVALSQSNFGSVPKSYVRTTIDKVTSPGLQDRMISNWPVESVHEVRSGHFPAFSVPAELAEALLKAVTQIEPALV